MTVIAIATGTGLSSSARDVGQAAKDGHAQVAHGVTVSRNTDARRTELGARSLDVFLADSMSGTPRSPTAAGVAATTASDPCRAARGAVHWYRAKYVGWRSRVGAAAYSSRALIAPRTPSVCPHYLARLLRSKARTARLAYIEWREYHWHWQAWLPSKWQRIGACETGYGRRPGDWHWNSGQYQGFAGFAVSSWDAFVPYASRKARPYPSEAYNATPRQQYEVALAIYRRFGLSGWGCRNA